MNDYKITGKGKHIYRQQGEYSSTWNDGAAEVCGACRCIVHFTIALSIEGE